MALLVALAWCLATAFSVAPWVSWWGSYRRWSGLFAQLTYLGVFLLAAGTLRNQRMIARFAAATTVAASIAAAYALVQRVGGDPFSWTSRSPLPITERPFGTMGNPAFLAALLAPALFVALGGLLAQQRVAWRLAWAAAAVIQLIGLLLTQSRAGWAGAVGGLLVFVILLVARRRRVAREILVLPGVTVVVVVAVQLFTPSGGALPGQTIAARAMSAFDASNPSVATRLALWRATLERVWDRPLLGFGPDTLGAVIARSYPSDLYDVEGAPQVTIDRAHNAVLDTLAASGAVGVASLLLVGGCVAMSAWRLRERGEPATDLAGHIYVPALVAALAAHVMEQQFDVDVVAVSTLAWTIAGAVVGAAWLPARSSPRTPHQVPAPLAAGDPAPRLGSARVALAVCFALAVSLPFGWWLTSQLRADGAYLRDLGLERDGHTIQAVMVLTDAVAMWPHEPTYWNELGKAWFALARRQSGAGSAQAYDQAVAAANRATWLAPGFPLFWSNAGLFAGEAATSSGSADLAARARHAHAMATQLAPGFWVYWRDAGATHLKLGDFAAAEDDLLRAVTLYGNDRVTWSVLGDAARAAGHSDVARRAYTQALAMNPPDPQPLENALQSLPP